jgi:putative hydrolase of the HAD superfamily
VKYLIWDFDGTLGYRIGMWSGALAEVLQHALPVCRATADDLRPYLQRGFPWHHPEQPHTACQDADTWWTALAPVFARAFRCGAGLSPHQALCFAQQVRQVYLNPTRWRLFEDTLPCLRALTAQDWQHVMLSNHVPELPVLIEALGLAPYMATVFTSAATGFEKPHPQAFHTVLRMLGSATTVWMVGDSVTADVAGAHAVGLRAILVRSQHPQAPHCCETLAELPRLLNQRI